jgi:acyl carrier protein
VTTSVLRRWFTHGAREQYPSLDCRRAFREHAQVSEIQELRMGVADGVKRVIAKELKLPIEQLSDDTKFADLGAESIDIIEIVFALEEKYDIDISVNFNQAGTDVSKSQPQMSRTDLATIGDICNAVQSLLDSKATG